MNPLPTTTDSVALDAAAHNDDIKRATPSSRQWPRDLACAAVIVAAVCTFGLRLAVFIEDQDRPWIFERLFWFAFGVAMFMAWRSSRTMRLAGVAWSTTSIVFAVGVIVAAWIRVQYLSTIVLFASEPEFAKLFGDAIAAAAGNHAVGLGTCFAGGTALVRLIAGRGLDRLGSYLFLIDQHRPTPCPVCGTPHLASNVGAADSRTSAAA